MCENTGDDEQVVPGISISPSGQATVDSSLENVLFDLAMKLEEPVGSKNSAERKVLGIKAIEQPP